MAKAVPTPIATPSKAVSTGRPAATKEQGQQQDEDGEPQADRLVPAQWGFGRVEGTTGVCREARALHGLLGHQEEIAERVRGKAVELRGELDGEKRHPTVVADPDGGQGPVTDAQRTSLGGRSGCEAVEVSHNRRDGGVDGLTDRCGR